LVVTPSRMPRDSASRISLMLPVSMKNCMCQSLSARGAL
jgi:hypothetical protein